MGIGPSYILNSVRGFFKSVLEKMMLEERSTYLLDKQNTKGNGYYERKIGSIFGEIPDLQVPRTRDSSFRSELVPQGKTDPQLEQLIFQLYASGISTRKIETVLTKHFGVKYSHSSIGRLSKVVFEEIVKWKQRPLGDYAVIFIDAFFFPL